jgi:hypothetical protein
MIIVQMIQKIKRNQQKVINILKKLYDQFSFN